MSDRDAVIATVLQGTPWATWEQVPITGDASARRYVRLRKGKDQVILMDAPPADCPDTARFAQIAGLLNSAGLTAPQVLHADFGAGVLVLTDLGATDFASHLRSAPNDETRLYLAATDVLQEVASIAPPPDMHRLTPEVGAQMLAPLGTDYVGGDIANLQAELEDALSRHTGPADTLALRDFHAENLIWRPEHSGTARVGLLDFQDAFVAPAGYDLASLLRDARRDVSASTSTAVINRFVSAVPTDSARLRRQIALLGAQRNLRILGIFAQLSRVQGKRRYLQFMDRVWNHILADLDDPALADLRAAVLAVVPPPTPAHLERLAP